MLTMLSLRANCIVGPEGELHKDVLHYSLSYVRKDTAGGLCPSGERLSLEKTVQNYYYLDL
jgi:hypothetical protein